METIKFIGILSVTWLFTTGAGSVQQIKKWLNIDNLAEPRAPELKVIRNLINCSMCSGFWIGLTYYQDFLIACIVSIAAELFTRLLKVIMSWI